MNFRTNIATAFAAILLSGGASHAAGPAPVESPYDWGGSYVGFDAAFLRGSVGYDEPTDPLFGRNASDGSFSGGGFIGYNYQTENTLLGVESDIGFGGVTIGAHTGAINNDYTAFDGNWNAHVRARLGYAADRSLFYVAGGLALTDLDVDDVDPGFGDDSAMHLGWTIGAGMEYAATSRMLFRVEYLYDDYGSENYAIDLGGVPNYGAVVKLTAQTVRVGVTYKF